MPETTDARNPCALDPWEGFAVIDANDAQAGARRRVLAEAQETAQAAAQDLLRAHLTKKQRAQYDADQTFTVTLTGDPPKSKKLPKLPRRRHYTLTPAYANNISLNDKYLLCAVPANEMPMPDVLLAQKLWLQTREREFLETAIWTPSYRRGLLPLPDLFVDIEPDANGLRYIVTVTSDGLSWIPAPPIDLSIMLRTEPATSDRE